MEKIYSCGVALVGINSKIMRNNRVLEERMELITKEGILPKTTYNQAFICYKMMNENGRERREKREERRECMEQILKNKR